MNVAVAALLLIQAAASGSDLMAMAKARLDAKDRDAARALYEQAATTCEAAKDYRCAGLAYNELGLMAFYDGTAGQVARWYGRAAEAFDRASLRREQAMALRAITFDAAMTAADRLAALDRASAVAAATEDDNLKGLIRHAQGDGLFVAGRYAESQVALEEALAMLEHAGNQGNVARVLTSLGRGFRLHGRPDLALRSYERALAIQQQLKDLQGQSQTWNAISIALMALGRTGEATKASEQSLAFAREFNAAAQIVSRMGQLGARYADAGRHDIAREMLTEAIRRSNEAGNIDYADEFYLNLADVEIASGRYGEALAAVNAGLDIAERRGQPEFIFEGYHSRAQVHEALGSLEAAIADAARAVALIESMRAALVPEDALKQRFADTNRSVYSTYIRLLTKSGRHADALLAAERGRSRAFLDLLATRSIGSETGREPTLLSKLRDPREPLLRSFVSADPLPREGVTRIAQRLGTHILTYWVDPDAVTVAVAAPDGTVNAARVAVTSRRLESLVRSTWQASAGAPATMTRGPAGRIQMDGRSRDAFRDLYDALILPVRRWLPPRGSARLTIVPHGPLFRLSFAALVNERSQYLIEGYSLHYTPSIAVLDLTDAHRAASAGGPPLMVADPEVRVTVAGESLGALPAARREADGVAAALRGERPVRLTGAPATERRVRELAPGARILHFATHGIVPDDRPFDAFLALSGNEKDPSGDGKLTAREVYDLKLAAELVVLSGCRTARGEVTGDGVLGLSRAFLYAGTPSLMATLWDVYDDAGAQLMPAFYAHWSQRGDKAAALRDAQVDLIRRLRAGTVKVSTPAGDFVVPEHPAFWAGFVLIGEP